jgi:hypothetical protein
VSTPATCEAGRGGVALDGQYDTVRCLGCYSISIAMLLSHQFPKSLLSPHQLGGMKIQALHLCGPSPNGLTSAQWLPRCDQTSALLRE